MYNKSLINGVIGRVKQAEPLTIIYDDYLSKPLEFFEKRLEDITKEEEFHMQQLVDFLRLAIQESEPIDYFFLYMEALLTRLANESTAEREKELLFRFFIYSQASNESILAYPSLKPFLAEMKDPTVFYTTIRPYHSKTDRYLTLIKPLTKGSTQFVFLAVDEDNREWVVKWLDPAYENINTEINNQHKMRDLGGKTYDSEKDWKILDTPMIISEKLLPIDEYDDEYEIGIQLLLTQLPYIHEFAVHADLKPDNIMKRNTVNGPLYFIIDFDLSDKHPYITKSIFGIENLGYQRVISTPLYGPRLFDGNSQMCSYKTDIFELGYVLWALQMQRQRILGSGIFSTEMKATITKENDLQIDEMKDPEQFLSKISSKSERYYKLFDFTERLLKTPERILPDRYIFRFNDYFKQSALLPCALEKVNYTIYKKLAGELEHIQQWRIKQRAGYLVSDLPEKKIKSCIRCGNSYPGFVEEGNRERFFCNLVCQNVFYKYHH